ncbi:roadblock/LC7 domain-containing protein, partial [Streptomyces megasporus]|uniref:roadblock/LC7 domain-containing protein n=1 Tax=Streptomyces megasporus TaxID=44060 RepID=UPI0004E258E6
DGLVKAAHGLDTDTADHLAALASGLYSLARFVSTAGSGACLAVLADAEADAAVLGYEMAMLVKQVRTHLATPARRSETP